MDTYQALKRETTPSLRIKGKKEKCTNKCLHDQRQAEGLQVDYFQSSMHA
jgi:hypothetical protein